MPEANAMPEDQPENQRDDQLDDGLDDQRDDVTEIVSEHAQEAALGGAPDNVQRIVDALDDKRARDIVVLNLREVSTSLDWFVIATGESALQLRALETGVRDSLKEFGVRPRGVEGPSDRWVLLDYGGIVAHLMSPEARAFYDLEGLWADAERVPVTPQ